MCFFLQPKRGAEAAAVGRRTSSSILCFVPFATASIGSCFRSLLKSILALGYIMLSWSIESFVPRSATDTLAFLFLHLAVFTTFVFEVAVVIQSIHGDNIWPKLVHCAVGMYILHVILGNLFHLIRTDTSIRTLVLPTVLDPKSGWRYCSVCEASCPPRSYHCQPCGVCILRRDHHCTFAGVCVGYKNTRYFMSMLVGIFFGAGYSTILNNFFIWDILGGFSINSFFHHSFPLIFYMFGRLTFSKAVFCLVSVTDACGCLFAFGLFMYQCSTIIRNQTNFEKNRRITSYDLKDWRANVEEVLGDRWHLIWISPLIKSSLPRDGIYFPTYEEYQLAAKKSR